MDIKESGLGLYNARLAPDPPRRRWFLPRYSLATLFVVVTVFGVWLGMQVKWIRDRHEFLNRTLDRKTDVCRIGGVHDAPGTLRLFGERGVTLILTTEQETIEIARHLFPEATVRKPRYEGPSSSQQH